MTYDIIYKKLNDDAIVPTKGSEYAAGYDLYACISHPVDIRPGKTKKIGTGLAFELPYGKFAGIFARSGLATKEGLRPANCVGVCDADYRGEYIVAIHNDSDEVRTIVPGERIAQMILMPFVDMNFISSDQLTPTDRGANGFDSTGH